MTKHQAPPDDRKKEDAADSEQDRTPDIAGGGNIFQKLVPVMVAAMPPVLANFHQIVHGNHEVEQGAGASTSPYTFLSALRCVPVSIVFRLRDDL